MMDNKETSAVVKMVENDWNFTILNVFPPSLINFLFIISQKNWLIVSLLKISI